MNRKQSGPKLTRVGKARKLTQGSIDGMAMEADGIRHYTP